MNRFPRLIAALAVAAMALAPLVADARPGGGISSGSRGARTYSAPPATNTAPGQARPMERTTNEPGRAAPSVTPGVGAGAAATAGRQGNWFQRNPFMGGLLAGGLLGAMMGGGFFSGLGSLAGVLGFLLQFALIGGLVFLLVSLLRRRQQPALAGMSREMQAGASQHLTGGGSALPRVAITGADQEAFSQSLIAINQAWSAGDTAALGRLTTPEMMQYFRDDYAALAARGWKNQTSEVRLDSGDVAEAWSEGAREYCTVAMRFSLVDVTRDAAGAVVEGHPTNREVVTEIWTFVRVQGREWQLSAIQQPS